MTLKNKIVSADEAIAIIRDGDTICVSGFVYLVISQEQGWAAEGPCEKSKKQSPKLDKLDPQKPDP